MKKIFVIFIALAGLMINSCKCTTKQAELTAQNTEIVVENTISMDREAMFVNHANDYRWYETGVVLKDFLDEENDGTIDMVVNVFQSVEMLDSTSFDTFVTKYQHTYAGDIEETIHGFWVEDYPLNDEEIKITFKEAYEKVMEVNLPKPHTRQVVLRKQVGPVDAYPLWICGNLKSQMDVDAVTGEVSDENPAFKALGFKMPLGEWP